MKHVFMPVIVFLLLFLNGSMVDARWIPENATPEDVKRLIRMEKEDKERIIREQYLREKVEQQQQQASGVIPSPDGIIDREKEASSKLSSQAQVSTTDKSGVIQHQAAQEVTGVSTNKQTMPSADKETEKSTEAKKIHETGWKDWLAIGFFILIFIGSLAFYLYIMNKSGGKTTGQKQATKDIASKGLTLLEIMVATAVIA
ncbi:MAG: hypothetical protein AAB296_00235, partial [Candidatus Desantisbacteria bacterium]